MRTTTSNKKHRIVQIFVRIHEKSLLAGFALTLTLMTIFCVLGAHFPTGDIELEPPLEAAIEIFVRAIMIGAMLIFFMASVVSMRLNAFHTSPVKLEERFGARNKDSKGQGKESESS